MPDAFQVEPGRLRSAAESVEGCRRQLESGRKADAGGAVSSGLAGFAVVGACESAGEKSGMAFSGVAKSWQAWSEAAATGADRYERLDELKASVFRGAVV
jgi:hypothetical protein